MCGGRADHHDDLTSPELETPTGDGRRHLHDSDGSKTLTTVLAVLGSSRGERVAESCLERGNQEGDGLSKGPKQATLNSEDKLTREQPMASGQKATVGKRGSPIFCNDGCAIGNTLGV